MSANRTPITGAVRVTLSGSGKLAIFGCGLRHLLDVPTQRGKWRLALNVTAPYVPITTEGKEPDLATFKDAILAALSGAIKRAHRNMPKRRSIKQKDVVLANLDEAIAKASGDGRYRFEQRQLLYTLRPIVMREMDVQLQWDHHGLRGRAWRDRGHVSRQSRRDLSSAHRRGRHPGRHFDGRKL
jgi:hypothetical protein